MMIDSLGRSIRYLRLSITPACPMQCSYCRPAVRDRGDRPVLTLEEIVALARHLVVRHGVTKVRLSGGEPTSRPDLPWLVRRLSGIEGLVDLAMTTNGLSLERQAAALAEAGLGRVNVSLDSLCRQNFERITGIDGLDRVLCGLDAAAAAGLSPVKLNVVVVRGENDHELPALVEFAAQRQLEMRLIELMPMGPLADRWEQRFVSEEVMRQSLADTVVSWEPLPTEAESARRFSVGLNNGRRAILGFIAAMSRPFCDRCNRIRIASDGSFYPCLMGPAGATLLPALRPVFNPAAVDELIKAHLSEKAAQHPIAGVAVMGDLGG
jgi:cyclic pyranopterin phosphate synthase